MKLIGLEGEEDEGLYFILGLVSFQISHNYPLAGGITIFQSVRLTTKSLIQPATRGQIEFWD